MNSQLEDSKTIKLHSKKNIEVDKVFKEII